MTDISASAVASLRARTGVSILACKDALIEANGDEEKAIEILRKRGISQAAKKADRDQAEGRVFVADEGGKAAIVLLKCETDFVARETAFQELGKELAHALLHSGKDHAHAKAGESLPELVQKLGENITLGHVELVEAPVIGTYVHSNSKIGVIVGADGGTVEAARDVAMHAAAMSPSYTSPDDISEETVSKEKEIWKEQLKREGKPEAIWDKIMMGKEKKFREENALIKQAFVKDPSKTVEQYLGAKVTAYVRLAA